MNLEFNGNESPFELGHAERLLRMPNNGGWTLPEKSPFQFDPTNGIRPKSNQGTAQRAEEKTDNK